MIARITYCLLFCGLFAGTEIGAQNIHFSQFFGAPLLTNPANTGLFDEAAMHRVGGNFRNQWATIREPFTHRTVSAFYDTKLLSGKVRDSWFGGGAMLFRDEAGDGHLTSTRIYLNVAFHKILVEKHMISFALGGGWAQRSIDFSQLYFRNQWGNNGFDVNAPAGENFSSEQTSYFDSHLGANWNYQYAPTLSFQVGMALFHLNRPQDSFFGTDNNMAWRPVFTAGSRISVTDAIDLLPRLMYTRQRTAQEFILGMEAGYRLPQYGDKMTVYLGSWFRNGDALIASTGLKIGSVRGGFGYDINLSPLRPASRRRGGPELFIIYCFGSETPNLPYSMPCKRM